ncbi:UNVERIFIED_CONTAM: hypothetical protein K2H54_005143 [Gekko kuhli]
MTPVFGFGNHNECYKNFTVKHKNWGWGRSCQARVVPLEKAQAGVRASEPDSCLLMHTETHLYPTSDQQFTCTVVYYYGIGVFLLFCLASFIAILVLLLQARALYKRSVNSTGYLGDQQWAMIKMVEQRVVLYPIVFFCCWGPAFILGIVKLTNLESASGLYMALNVLEALTASSQGLLNCAVYGWTQHMFRCMKRKACRDVDTQTPLLRSQKRFYASTHPVNTREAATSPSTGL